MRKIVSWVFIPLLLLMLASLPLVGAAVIMARNAYCSSANNIVAAGAVGLPSAQGLSAEQLANARLTIGIGKSRGRPARDVEIALMTEYQESGMHNLGYGDRDSLGLFQQRPSQGWGTPQQIMDPTYAINKFYERLEKITGRDSRSLIDVAMAVQRPSLAAYTSPTHSFMSWEGMALQLLAGYAANGTASAPMVYSDTCSNNQSNNIVTNTTGSWRKPLDVLQVSSPWGMRVHPILHVLKLHDGVDFVATTGTPIYSIGSGKITVIAFNGAIGNHVTVDYGGGNVVTYEHMSRFGGFSVGATVSPGDVLGYVGATGLATGPHLHLGWVKNGQNIDPVPELCGRGIVVPGPQGCSKYNL